MDAIVLFDADGRISLVNTAAEQMFGTSVDAAVGTSIARFFALPDGGDAVAAISAAAEQQRDHPAAKSLRHESSLEM